VSSNDRDVKGPERDWSHDSKLFAELVETWAGEGVRRAIAEHHRLGYAVPISRNGQNVKWHPDGSYRPVEEEAASVGSPADEPALGEQEG
jgi:hypothetical protein